MKLYYCMGAGLLFFAAFFVGNAVALSPNNMNQCVALGKGGYVINNCNETIIVSWHDEGEICGAGMTECGVTVGPNSKQPIHGVKGNFQFGACKYPSVPAMGANGFSCN